MDILILESIALCLITVALGFIALRRGRNKELSNQAWLLYYSAQSPGIGKLGK